LPFAEANRARVCVTDRFYRHGATFAKWNALEYGLDVMGRHGFICLLDADVVWPWDLKGWQPQKGKLHCPLRRMMTDTSRLLANGIPAEDTWGRWPIHRNVMEFAGYSQIFHAEDPVLGRPPWFDVRWSHAGGGDSELQARWAPENKIRPPWECLHLGESGTNWAGRVSPRLDGTIPEGADQRREALRQMIRQRRPGPGKFDHEKL